MNLYRLVLLCVALGALAWSPAAEAKKKKRAPIRKADNLGLGVGAIGVATGVSGKYYLDKSLSVQGVLGTWGLGQETPDGLTLAGNADALIEFPVVAKTDLFRVAPVLGASGWVRMATELTEMGVGGVFGVSLLMKKQPIEITLEYRPTYGIINIPQEDALDLIGFGLQARYYFPMSRFR